MKTIDVTCTPYNQILITVPSEDEQIEHTWQDKSGLTSPNYSESVPIVVSESPIIFVND